MPKLLHFRGSESKPRKAVDAVPAGWAESLARSEAQIAAGETMPLEPVLDELRASIARMEAKRTRKS
jgi:hypothetical protein